jgi:hypothetical protein
MNSLFAEGIRNIVFSNGIVKIEFGVTVPSEGDKPEPTTAFTVNIPLPGLMQSHNQLTKMIDGLVEKGVLRKKDEKPAKVTN